MVKLEILSNDPLFSDVSSTIISLMIFVGMGSE